MLGKTEKKTGPCVRKSVCTYQKNLNFCKQLYAYFTKL